MVDRWKELQKELGDEFCEDGGGEVVRKGFTVSHEMEGPGKEVGRFEGRFVTSFEKMREVVPERHAMEFFNGRLMADYEGIVKKGMEGGESRMHIQARLDAYPEELSSSNMDLLDRKLRIESCKVLLMEEAGKRGQMELSDEIKGMGNRRDLDLLAKKLNVSVESVMLKLWEDEWGE